MAISTDLGPFPHQENEKINCIKFVQLVFVLLLHMFELLDQQHLRTPLLTFLCRETSKFHRFSRFFHHCERRYPVSLTLVVSFGDRLIVSSTGKVNFVFAEMFLCEDIEENLRKEDLFYCFSLYHFLAMSPPW